MAPRKGWRPKKKPSGKKNPPKGDDRDLNLVSMLPLFSDENKAREFMEKKRWPNGAVCPRCKCEKVYKLEPKAESKRPVRPGVYKCSGCRRQFTVRIGTIFEESKIPISKWLFAIHLMCASKNGISSHELARELDVTQKTAWFLCHRIREAMKKEPMAGMLRGEIEADEAYVGGKPRKRNKRRTADPDESGKPITGRGTKKTPVLALVQRDGDVVSMPIQHVDRETLGGALRSYVDKDSTIFTDEWTGYVGVGPDFDGGHHTVCHSRNEYVRYEQCGPVFVSTNTVESYFARVKRSHYGVHHQMSKRHLHRYVTEAAFKWNTRRCSDGERMVNAIKGAEGKRLRYREPAQESGAA